MHHTSVFLTAVGQTADTVLAAQTDQILPIDSSNSFLPPDPLMLLAAYAAGATLNRARFDSPRYRQIAQPFIQPTNLTLLPATNPNVQDFRDNPLRIPALSPFSVQATSALACGTEVTTCVVWLARDRVAAPVGDIYGLRATGATTVVAKAWSDVALTFTQSIVEGEYAVVGGNCFGATMIAWRLILDNQFYRPGGLGFATLGLRAPLFQYAGGLGNWGTFRNTSMPRLQVYCNAADTAQTLFLQVIKLR